MTPLTNKIDVGEEPFVLAVGEGSDSLTDLWAAPAGNGSFARLTFTRAEERGPRLAPEGRRVAYLRHAPGSPAWSLVILDLNTNAEHSAVLPPAAGPPERLGWGAEGNSIVVSAGAYFTTAVPPAAMQLSPISGGATGWADSVTRERLGAGLQGTLEPCDSTLCVVVGEAVTRLGGGPAVSGAVRWGSDSVGYFRSGQFEVRPLSGGQTRRPGWKGLPSRLRDVTYHPGVSSRP